ILGTLEPDSGSVRLGTKIEVAYFDQMREALDPEKTVAETIAPGSDWVDLPGGRKHVMSYLGDFLFPPRRAQSPVRMLSGGERNRLLLARLVARPANLLVLDEPTNDLDIESLELVVVFFFKQKTAYEIGWTPFTLTFNQTRQPAATIPCG